MADKYFIHIKYPSEFLSVNHFYPIPEGASYRKIYRSFHFSKLKYPLSSELISLPSKNKLSFQGPWANIVRFKFSKGNLYIQYYAILKICLIVLIFLMHRVNMMTHFLSLCREYNDWNFKNICCNIIDLSCKRLRFSYWMIPQETKWPWIRTGIKFKSSLRC